MPKIIRKIEHPKGLERRLRVAAYARVSSGKDAMLHSLSAQVSYYSAFIQQHPGWQYCYYSVWEKRIRCSACWNGSALN